jgi:NADPH2:quinone reductase
VVGLVESAGWAQRAAIPAARLAVLPDSVSFEQTAALPIAGLTALRTVRLGGFLLGRRLLVTGASDGVGHLAVQIATLAGAQVTAIARTEHADELRRLGARQVVASTDQADGLFDHILESIGGSSFEAAVAHVAPAGTIVLFGNSVREASKLDFVRFFGHENARIQTYFSYASGSPADAGRDLGTLAG